MPNVLIVEDDLMIADMLQEVLESDGFSVIGISRTAAEAIVVADLTRPDFAVIDLNLADGDLGTAVGAHLRATRDIGIIISTGNDVIECTEACADAVMTKPYRLADVGSALRILHDLATDGETRVIFPRNFKLINDKLMQLNVV